MATVSPLRLEIFALFVENHRQMPVFGQVRADGFQDVDLFRGVVHMVVPADNVGNAHVVVVYHGAEVVGRRTVGAGNNQVV